MPTLSYHAQTARQHDRDRYYSSLFLPLKEREALYVLYTLQHEISRIRETVSEEMVGLIRLQWWRDAIADIYKGKIRNHDTLQALAPLITSANIPEERFETLFNAYESDLDAEPFSDMQAMMEYCVNTHGIFLEFGLRVLGEYTSENNHAAKHTSIAWGMTQILRRLPFYTSQGSCPLPFSLLEKHTMDVELLYAGKNSPSLAHVIDECCQKIEDEHKKTEALQGNISKKSAKFLSFSTLVPSYVKRIKRHKKQLLHHPISIAAPLALLALWKNMK